MKESGGGQDKQMSEIIDFISYGENNVSYISFLDGVYFNKLGNSKSYPTKISNQRTKIIMNLNKNKENYFINTQGFYKLLETIIKPSKI